MFYLIAITQSKIYNNFSPLEPINPAEHSSEHFLKETVRYFCLINTGLRHLDENMQNYGVWLQNHHIDNAWQYEDDYDEKWPSDCEDQDD